MTRRGQYTKEILHGGDTTQRRHHTEGTSHKKNATQREYVHGRDIHTRKTYIQRGHTHKKDIYIEGKYIWGGNTDRGDIYTKGIYIQKDIYTEIYMQRDLHREEHTYGRDIYIKQAMQMFWIICLATYLLKGLGPFVTYLLDKI